MERTKEDNQTYTKYSENANNINNKEKTQALCKNKKKYK